jgi:hypothetical protein
MFRQRDRFEPGSKGQVLFPEIDDALMQQCDILLFEQQQSYRCRDHAGQHNDGKTECKSCRVFHAVPPNAGCYVMSYQLQALLCVTDAAQSKSPCSSRVMRTSASHAVWRMSSSRSQSGIFPKTYIGQRRQEPHAGKRDLQQAEIACYR